MGADHDNPGDQVLLLRRLFAGSLLSAADRRYAMSLMENVWSGQRWGVSAGVLAGVRIALKNGWVPLTAPDADWQVNSAAAAPASAARSTSSPTRAQVPSRFLRSEGNNGAPGRPWSSSKRPHTSCTNHSKSLVRR